MFTVEEVSFLLEYNPDTGSITWLERPATSRFNKTFNTRYAGKEAFSYTTTYGYKEGSLLNQRVLAHTVAYLFKTGEWVIGLDHLNGDKADNRACNLRKADHALNARNMPKKKTNTSGFTGVYWNKQRSKWQARLQVDGRQHHLGCFDTPEEANEARLEANEVHGFHANHGR